MNAPRLRRVALALALAVVLVAGAPGAAWTQPTSGGPGPLVYLAPEEAEKINARAGADGPGVVRSWELWKRKAMAK